MFNADFIVCTEADCEGLLHDNAYSVHEGFAVHTVHKYFSRRACARYNGLSSFNFRD